MTHQLNQHDDPDTHRMMIGTPPAICKILLATAVLIAWGGDRCAAQNVSYPHSYPVTNSYPANSYPASSYPVEQPVAVNQAPPFVGSNVSYPSMVIRESSTQNSTISSAPVHASAAPRTSTSAFRSTPIVRNGSFDTTNSNPNSRPSSRGDSVARLTSNKTYGSRPQFPFADSLDARRPAVEPVSPYGLAMSQSARQSATQFRMIAQSALPIAAEIANENANFAEQWANLAESHSALSDRVGDATTKLLATTGDFEDVNSKLTKYGLTPTIGLLLRHKKEQLDAWQVHDSQTFFASQELNRSRQKQLELEMVRYDGADAARETAEILADAGYDSTSFQHATLASQVHGLLLQRGQWLGSLQRGYQDYQQKLGEFDATATASAKLSSDYRKLIDRHITWIRSGDPVSIRDLHNFNGGLSALFDSRRSADFGPTLERKLKSNAVGGIGLLAWIVLISLARWRAKSWLVSIGSGKRMREATANSRKVAAGVLTTVVALAIPGILYAIATLVG